MTNDLLIYDENVCAFPHILYDCAPDSIWIYLYMRKILYSFYQCIHFHHLCLQVVISSGRIKLLALSSVHSLHCKCTVPKFKTNISSNETARPRSQFLHSCIWDRFLYSHDRSAKEKNRRTVRGNIKIAHRFKSMGYFYNGYWHLYSTILDWINM